METNFALVADEWKMKHSDLEIQGQLGKGQFGDVVLAFLKSTSCTSKVKNYIDRMLMQGDSLSTSKTVAVKYLKGKKSCVNNSKGILLMDDSITNFWYHMHCYTLPESLI